MPRLKVLAALSLGVLAAACGSPYDQPAPVPYVATTTTTQYVVMPVSERNCIDYGFVVGTATYDRCVTHEARARALGRMSRDYALVRIAADARDACYSYGLEPGTVRYDRCVNREIDARRYREEAYLPPPAPAVVQYVYTPPRYDRRVASTGVEVFRDEYGFRYDSQGNRIDAYGNVISPHSTTP
jgi:hypothetical protein